MVCSLTSALHLSGESVNKLLSDAVRYSLNAFPNIITAAKITLTTALCERSFSKLKLMKTDNALVMLEMLEVSRCS